MNIVDVLQILQEEVWRVHRLRTSMDVWLSFLPSQRGYTGRDKSWESSLVSYYYSVFCGSMGGQQTVVWYALLLVKASLSDKLFDLKSYYVITFTFYILNDRYAEINFCYFLPNKNTACNFFFFLLVLLHVLCTIITILYADVHVHVHSTTYEKSQLISFGSVCEQIFLA